MPEVKKVIYCSLTFTAWKSFTLTTIQTCLVQTNCFYFPLVSNISFNSHLTLKISKHRMKFTEAWQGCVRVMTKHTVIEFTFFNLLILKILFSGEKTDDTCFFLYLGEGRRFMLMFTRFTFQYYSQHNKDCRGRKIDALNLN